MTNPEWMKRMRETYSEPRDRDIHGKREALPSEIEKALDEGQEASFEELVDLYSPTEDDIGGFLLVDK